MSATPIAIVDLGRCETSQSALEESADSLVESIRNSGVAFIRNTGIQESQVKHAESVANDFLALPQDVKNRFVDRSSAQTDGLGSVVHSYVNMDAARIGTEYWKTRESLIFNPDIKMGFPDDVVPGFSDSWKAFSISCDDVIRRVLKLLDASLNTRLCQVFNSEEERSKSVKFNHYPAIQTNEDVCGKIRVRAHSDPGILSLLFQDNIGGLQVENNGEFVDVAPEEGAILVQANQLLAQHTGDRLKEVHHRVIVPTDPKIACLQRQTLSYFLL
ncbi:unnamed protein product [Owenia fusiformis]|uniref:Uncharacterized protein n=1 Tax=Owenia fusiformis TaxID=6347 RepID=A0A8J1UCA0_OWEFU|nr:unnamed protein product [Owenia fusiformis]